MDRDSRTYGIIAREMHKNQPPREFTIGGARYRYVGSTDQVHLGEHLLLGASDCPSPVTIRWHTEKPVLDCVEVDFEFTHGRLLVETCFRLYREGKLVQEESL